MYEYQIKKVQTRNEEKFIFRLKKKKIVYMYIKIKDGKARESWQRLSTTMGRTQKQQLSHSDDPVQFVNEL